MYAFTCFIYFNEWPSYFKDQKDDLIEGLRKERNEHKKQVEDLKKALQNKQNKI